jgi:hypothetical protein
MISSLPFQQKKQIQHGCGVQTNLKSKILQCFFGIFRLRHSHRTRIGIGKQVFLPLVAHKHALTSQYATFPVFEQPNTNYPLGWKDKSSIPSWVQVKGVYQQRINIEEPLISLIRKSQHQSTMKIGTKISQ